MDIIAMLPTIVTIAFAVVLLLNILTNVLRGLSKGLFPTLVRLGSILVSGVLAAIVSVPIGRIIPGALVSKINEMISGMFPSYADILALSPSASDLMVGIPAIFISIILYFLLFGIFRLLMKIPERIIRKRVFEKRLAGAPKRTWAGALCGIVAGVAVFVFTTAPICGTLETVGDTAGAIVGERADDAEDGFTVYGDVIEPISDGFFVKFTCSLGGRAVYNRLTVIEVGGEKVSINREVRVFSDVLKAVKPLLSGGGMSSLTRDDITLLSSASRRLSDSKIVSGLLADILSGAAQKWADGESFLGLGLPPAGEGGYSDFLIEFLLAFKNTTKETVGEDIGTLADVLALLYDSGMLENKEGSSIADSLGKEGLISALLETVMKNERFSGTAAAIINLGVQSTLDTLGVPASSEDVYDGLVSDISNAVNSDSNLEELEKKTYDSFEKRGIKTDKRVTDLTAKYLKEDFEGRQDVTEGEISTFLSVAFASAPAQAKGPEPVSGARDLAKALAALKNEGVEGINWDALHSLASRDTFITSLLTYETISVTKEALDALADSELSAECGKVEEMIIKFLKFSSSAKDGNVIENADVASLGDALNIIEKSAILSEVSEDMIRAIFSSHLVKDHVKISDNTVDKMIESEDTDYNDILVSVQNTTGIINGLSKEEGKISDEALDEKIDYLLGDMSENTADVIGEVFDSENVQKLGVAEEKADKMADSLGVFFDKMAESDADTSNPEDKDVKATKAVFKFMAASKTDTSDVFAETGLTPDETVKTFMDSEISRETIVEASYSDGELQMDSFGLAEKLNEEGRNKALASMEEHVKENYENEEDKEQYEKTVIAIGALLGMDVSDDLASWIK